MCREFYIYVSRYQPVALSINTESRGSVANEGMIIRSFMNQAIENVEPMMIDQRIIIILRSHILGPVRQAVRLGHLDIH